MQMKRAPWIAFLFAGLASMAAADYSIEVDLQEQRAYLLYHRRMVLETPICSGRPNYPTPTGTFQVMEKDALHRSSLYGKIVDAQGRTVIVDADADMAVPPGMRFVNAPMPYFLRFTSGIGLHAGYLPGYAASHGCVRLPKERAIAFYNAVEVGTPVTVFGRSPSSSMATVPSRTPFQRWIPSFPRY